MSGTDRFNTLLYRMGWKIGCHVPQWAVNPVLDRAADRLARRDGPHLKRLESNLARAAGTFDPDEVSELGRLAIRSYLRYWAEAFRLPRLSPEQIRNQVITENEHLVRDAYAEGKGVVAVLPHMGNWDLAGAWACTQGMPLMTVAERLRPERLFDEFVEFRSGLGMQVLALTGGPPTVPALTDYVRRGGLVCLLGDRDLSRTGIEVDLLGEPAKLPAGPAMIARVTGATLLPVSSNFEGGRMRLRFFEPIEHRPGRDGLRAMTADVADAFSVAIRDHPLDWHMLQRVFVRDLDRIGSRR